MVNALSALQAIGQLAQTSKATPAQNTDANAKANVFANTGTDNVDITNVFGAHGSVDQAAASPIAKNFQEWIIKNLADGKLRQNEDGIYLKDSPGYNRSAEYRNKFENGHRVTELTHGNLIALAKRYLTDKYGEALPAEAKAFLSDIQDGQKFAKLATKTDSNSKTATCGFNTLDDIVKLSLDVDFIKDIY